MLFVFRGKSKFLKVLFFSAHKLCRPDTFLFTSIVAHQTHKFIFEEGYSKCLESPVWGSTADPLITKSQNQTKKGPVWAFELWWNYCVCGPMPKPSYRLWNNLHKCAKVHESFLVRTASIIHCRVGTRLSVYQYLCRNGFRVTHVPKLSDLAVYPTMSWGERFPPRTQKTPTEKAKMNDGFSLNEKKRQ